MSGALANIRQRVAAAIAANAPGWVESPWPYPLFPGPEPAHILAQGYAVGLSDTRMETRDRQNLSVGGFAATTVAVRFSRLVTVQDQVGEYDAALDAELVLVAAILEDRDLAASLRLDGTVMREIVAEGSAYLCELRFTCRHQYPLADDI